MDESFTLSARVIEGLVTYVRDNFAALGVLSSALSLLDMLLAFATRVMSSRGRGGVRTSSYLSGVAGVRLGGWRRETRGLEA